MHNRWFKCAVAKKLITDSPINQSSWEPKLKELKHIDIKPNQEISVGFSPVFGHLAPNMQSHQIQNFLFISFTVEEKKIQKSRMKRLQTEEINKKAKSMNIKINELGKDVIDGIKESVKLQMVRDTAASESYINIFIDTTNNVLYIDDTSPKKVEKITEWLLRIEPSLQFNDYFDASLELHLTSWLYAPAKMPSDIALASEATLVSSEKSKAALSGQDLESEEITILLNHDKKVADLALTYKARLDIKVKQDGTFAKIKPTDLLKSTVERPDDKESILQDIEADWVVMANEVYDLFDWFEKHADVSSTESQAHSSPNVVSITSSEDIEKEANSALENMTG